MIDNQYFLTKILADDSEYWVVAKPNTTRQYFETKRTENDIALISLTDIKRPMQLGELTINQLEPILSKDILTNLFLTSYSPFQWGINLKSFDDGFPLDSKTDIRKFTIEALKLESRNLSDYKKLAEECVK